MLETISFIFANITLLWTMTFIVSCSDDDDLFGTFMLSLFSIPLCLFLLAYSDITDATKTNYLYVIMTIALISIVLAIYKIIYFIMCDYKEPEEASKLLKKIIFSSVAAIFSSIASLLVGVTESISLISVSIGGLVYVSIGLFG